MGRAGHRGRCIMNVPNGEQRLELRDPEGNTLGFFVSDRKLREEAAERGTLRKQVAEMQDQIDELTREKERLHKEVDNYAKILEVWERDCVAPMTRKEMEHLEKHGIPFETVVAEVEEQIRSRSAGV